MTAENSTAPPLWALNGQQWLLETGALLNAIAFFAALPFASLYLDDHTTLSKPAIGAVVGGIALIAAFGGFLGGMLVDRFNTVWIMLFGLMLYTIDYTLLAFQRSDTLIIGLLLTLGAAKVLVDPGGKKLLSLAADPEGRVFRLRYMTLCLGGILGPAIGGALYSISPVWFFAVPAAVYLIYLSLFFSRRRVLAQLEEGHGGKPESYHFGAALRDRRLLLAVTAGFVIFFVFAQLESMIPLYIKGLRGEQAHAYFASLFIVNAVLALLFQIPIDRLSTKMERRQLILLGCLNFALAFLCFALASTHLGLLYLGIVFWTVGEGILLPLPDMAIHAIAVGDRKGAYFGLGEIRYVGFFAGPVVGGILLSGSDRLYFAAMGLAVFGCAPLLIAKGTSAPSTGPSPVVNMCCAP